MSNYHPLEKQCFFDQCRELAQHKIVFRGQTIKVCTDHDKRYGHSHETGSKRP